MKRLLLILALTGCDKPLIAARLGPRGARVASVERMTSAKQRAASKRNIKKAARAAKKKRTIANLPKKTRTALGKQANKVKRQRAHAS